MYSLTLAPTQWRMIGITASRQFSPKKIIALTMKHLEVHGKGILLLHDIHAATVAAMPGLLKELKQRGFKIVHVIPISVDQV